MKIELFDFKNNVWLFGAVLLTVFAISAGVRHQQFETWKKTPSAFYVEERPMMTTLDAPYWLRWAREYNEGVFRQKNGLRGYPDSSFDSAQGPPFKENQAAFLCRKNIGIYLMRMGAIKEVLSLRMRWMNCDIRMFLCLVI